MKNWRLEAVIIAVGLLMLGWMLRAGINDFRERERVVTVKGLAEMEVPADKDLRAALSAALGLAGCPVVAMAQQRMSLEDIFLQLTENAPDTADQPDDTDDAQPAEEAEETLPDETEEPQPPQESQQEEDAQ